jgi:hypothetical protein
MNTLTTTSGPSFSEMERLAEAIARSNMFGMKTKEQALVLMAISQAEGRHPALAARDYDVIQGRPAKKSEAMLRDFLDAGGKVQWHSLDDTVADATFSHPAGGTVRISWNMERAAKAGLGGKDNWKKFPRQMLRSRTISEGVRTVYPMATSGLYVPEEAAEFTGPTLEAHAETAQHDEKPAQSGGMVEEARALQANGEAPKRTTLRDVGASLVAAFGQAQSIGALAEIEERDELKKLFAKHPGSGEANAVRKARDEARERLAVVVEDAAPVDVEGGWET